MAQVVNGSWNMISICLHVGWIRAAQVQQAWRISHVALDMLAWVSFDKIHRLVRDLKCSVLHAAAGCSVFIICFK